MSAIHWWGRSGRGHCRKLSANCPRTFSNFPQNFRTLSCRNKKYSLQISANFPQNFRKLSAKTPFPDPPILAFLEKARAFPPKRKGFSLRGTPKILGKERKNAQKKQGKSENEKARKSKKARIGGSGLLRPPQVNCWKWHFSAHGAV